MERSYISRLERRLSQPTILALLKLAKGLGCDAAELCLNPPGHIRRILMRFLI
ncbi:helix-turn-helix domain-containing protein [Roseateles sp.]|uniref:helix-turn-helix domain-containing protein n=1 Tax=Roseateles TaxID=93681 RepID=UPI0035A14036